MGLGGLCLAFGLVDGTAHAQQRTREAGAATEPVNLETAARELAEVLPVGDADSRAAVLRLERFLERYEGRDLDRLGYARGIFLFLNGEYDAAVRAMEAYFTRYPRLALPQHACLVGRVYVNAIQEEAAERRVDVDRLRHYAERALELQQPAESVSLAVSRALDGAGGRESAGLRMLLVRRIMADGQLDDAGRDRALARLFTGVAAPPAPPAKLLALPAAAPLDWVADDLHGRRIDLASHRGRVVLLHFWASWCPISAGDAGNLLRLYLAHHTAGLDVIGVAAEEGVATAAVQNAARELGYLWPQLHESRGIHGQLAGQLGIAALPAIAVIDKQGVVRACGRTVAEVEPLTETLLGETVFATPRPRQAAGKR